MANQAVGGAGGGGGGGISTDQLINLVMQVTFYNILVPEDSYSQAIRDL